MDQQQFNVTVNGQARPVKGDPDRLTLRDLVNQATGQEQGKQGGGRSWQVRIAGKSYSESDFSQTLNDLGIPSSATIEINEGQPA